MAEPGGPTTQSGIFFQNSITALYLGRLCDESPRPDRDRLVQVRVEAPERVDDTVLYYADGGTVFIQSKQTIRTTDAAWRELWLAFVEQFHAKEFQRERDRLQLHIGDPHSEHRTYRELCKRSKGNRSVHEWLGRLNRSQSLAAEAIGKLLGPKLPGGQEAVMQLLSHVDVILWDFEHLEVNEAVKYMPETTSAPQTLFRLLRDRVGGAARTRGTFDARRLRAEITSEHGIEFRLPADLDALRAAVRECGALLRQHKGTVGRTGIHIDRKISAEIVTWAVGTASDSRVAMLLDGAGTGKSVVMRDVVLALEARGNDVLAIKADQQLSTVGERGDLHVRLGLPEAVDRVVGRLSAIRPVVVVLDQLDALSLSLAHDQRALDAVIALVARLRDLPGVTVLLSCRTFDRNTDPRLKRLDVGREFSLPPLDDEEVTPVLAALESDWESLTPATRQLVRVPLHLDLFARVIEAGGAEEKRLAHGLRTLQDLYTALWNDVVLQRLRFGPTIPERVDALRVVIEQMDRNQRTSVPRTVAVVGGQDLTAAADWLASEGILTAGPDEWTLIHQTFFDYCYARFFVEEGKDLSAHVIESDQGLFLRPQLVHVLSYLRGTESRGYLRAVSELLGSPRLRVHLRELLLRWLGALADPTEEEWTVVRRLLADMSARTRMLRAMTGNRAWFLRVRHGPLEGWLERKDDFFDDEVLTYLTATVETAAAEVCAVLESQIGKNEKWRRRFRAFFWRIRNWNEPVIELYERHLRTLPAEDVLATEAIDSVAKASPEKSTRVVRLVLESWLSLLARSGREGITELLV